MKKLWSWLISHKVFSILIAILLCLSLTAAIVLIPWQNTAGARLSRRDWTALFAQTFGYTQYEQTEPYFSDISADNEIFPYVQTLVEYAIIPDGDLFNPDVLPSGRQMLTEVARAFGEDYVARRLGLDSVSDEQFLSFLLTLAPLDRYDTNRGLTADRAATLLSVAYEAFLTRAYDNVSDITLAEGVQDLSALSYSVSGNQYTLTSDTPIAVGDIILLGITEADPDGETLKVDSVRAAGNQYTVTGSQPELDEVYDAFSLEINQIASVSEFVPAEGVTVTELDPDGGTMDVVWRGTSGPTPLSTNGGHTKLVSGSVNQNRPGTLFDMTGTWKSDGQPLVLSQKFRDILDQNPFYQNDVDVAVDQNGNLVHKYDRGYEISMGLKVSDLVLNGSATYTAGIFGTNKQLSFNLNAGITVEPTVSLAGNGNARIRLGTFHVPINIILSVKVDVYLVVDINGEISVSTEISGLANVNKSANSSRINASAKLDAYSELEANCELQLLVGPDPTITLAGIQLVDAYVLLGVGADMNYTTNRPDEIDIRVYLPLIQAGVGYNSQTILSKLGVAAGVNVMDKEGALLSCPFDKTITIDLCREEPKPVIEGVHHKFENGVLTVYGTGRMEDYLVDGVENTPYGAYADSLHTVVIEEGITYLGDACFSYLPNLATVVMADSVTSAGRFVFSNCPKLTDVSLSKGLTGYNSADEDECADMFSGCTGLTSITLPSSFVTVPPAMFAECSALKSVTLSANTTTIGDYAFSFTGLETITLPARVTTIGDNAFYACSSLREVTRLGRLSHIGRDAFEECPNLTAIPSI